ncbi:PREDICTED: F-box protein CPR30-like [Fragaria vesca subsp. vesca]|uniref:F-box protein CPR30-like n=1 Tax=Fragaria vesca subsp. vesca TaxID=101020 RepID=UPI0002C2FB2C|nr:PREDICTED: F-box protein CPR30-like [Fragaria vesca subsp. vesca]
MAETELPEDVTVNILCWLPVKSLIRFTSVSKRWRFIILSDPKFASSQFNAARQRRTFCTGAPQLESLDVDGTASFGHPSSVRKLSLPLERRGSRDVTLLGSCNGLVFLAFDSCYFYIWNPATRFFRELPDPGFPDHVCQVLTYGGVGYLSATEDYKVFATSYGLYPDGDSYVDTAQTKMFSYRAHFWKTVRGSAHYKCFAKGILLNEALHWAKSNEIIAFDFAPEKFRTMRMPDVDDQNDVAFGYVGVSEGCLCVCGYLRGGHDSVDYWVMREYGVDSSWTKLFNISSAGPGRYGDWLVMESCTVAVKGAIGFHHWLLVEIDHQQKAANGVYTVPGIINCYPSMIPYEDTLLRIND